MGARPASLQDYREFLQVIKRDFENETTAEERSKLFKRLIGRIEVGTDRVVIHYKIGAQVKKLGHGGQEGPQSPFFLKKKGSSTL